MARRGGRSGREAHVRAAVAERRLLHAQRPDGGWLNPFHLADAKSPCTTKGRWPWDRSCAWGSYYAARALHAAWQTSGVETPPMEWRDPQDRVSSGSPPLAAAAGFLHGHLSCAPEEVWQAWTYHGHNLVRELELYQDVGLPMNTPRVEKALTWLATHYHPEEGRFRATSRPHADFARLISDIVQDFEQTKGADYWQHASKVSLPVLRYTLYHLVEDDWLTFRLTRLAMKMKALRCFVWVAEKPVCTSIGLGHADVI